jgi:hypothetical protein
LVFFEVEKRLGRKLETTVLPSFILGTSVGFSSEKELYHRHSLEEIIGGV